MHTPEGYSSCTKRSVSGSGAPCRCCARAFGARPATVDTSPIGSIRRTVWFMLSTISTLPYLRGGDGNIRGWPIRLRVQYATWCNTLRITRRMIRNIVQSFNTT
eukprot:7948024-Pyramimonas_sp.AAC.1